MKLYSEDYDAAVTYEDANLRSFPRLTEIQLSELRARSKAYRAFVRTHPGIHNGISLAVLCTLLCSDIFVLAFLPAYLPALTTTAAKVAAGALSGFLHGFLVCSLVTYSVHEGAAHNLVALGDGRFARALRFAGSRACRLFFAVPDYYAESHFTHHNGMGTMGDGSFTHFVRRKRLLGALLPLAPVMSHSDYFPWRPQERTASRRLTNALANVTMLALAALCCVRFGAVYAGVAIFIVGAQVSFALDRLRESVEHAFMPLDRTNGTRQLGLGPWGLLLGGGPWGQSCHLSHHLEPALPWYMQIALHRDLHRILSAEQKKWFFVHPVTGIPSLLWRVFREGGGRQGRNAWKATVPS